MSNFKQHLTFGVLTGCMINAGMNYFQQNKNQSNNNKTDWNQVISKGLEGCVIGGLTACLPDMLEPATHPNHRSFFHSTALLLSLLSQINNKKITDKNTLNSAIGGYLSHLVLDSYTPKGLRLLY